MAAFVCCHVLPAYIERFESVEKVLLTQILKTINMEPGMSLKDRQLTYNTLVSLIKSIKGQQTTVDLRNGASVTGKIHFCDAYMNVDMSHVLFRDASGKPHIFENFFVHARNIRYVHIPPQVDMKKSVQSFLENSRIKKDPQRHSSSKGSRTMRKQAETVEHIRKLKEKKDLRA